MDTHSNLCICVWCCHPYYTLLSLSLLFTVTGLFFPHRYIDTSCSYIRWSSVGRGGWQSLQQLLLLVRALVLTVSKYIRIRVRLGLGQSRCYIHKYGVYAVYTEYAYNIHKYHTHSIAYAHDIAYTHINSVCTLYVIYTQTHAHTIHAYSTHKSITYTLYIAYYYRAYTYTQYTYNILILYIHTVDIYTIYIPNRIHLNYRCVFLQF